MNQKDNDLWFGRETTFIIHEYNPETGLLRSDYDEIIEKIRTFFISLGLQEYKEAKL